MASKNKNTITTLGDYLKGRGRQFKLDLARELGVTERTIDRYIDGTRRPGWDVLGKLRAATGGQVGPDSFLPPARAAA
jgi:hypothetical protein